MTADVTIYFGRPGSLITLPHPRGGVRATRDRPTFIYRTGGGGARVSKVVGGRRPFTLNWERLDYDTFSTLLAFDQGHEGPGPFALLDPGQRNQLTVNQSSATSETNDADNFTVAGSGYALSSDATTYRRGPRSLKVSIAYAAQSGTITLDPATPDWYGTPVASSRAMVFSYWAKGGGTDPVVTLTPRLAWYSAAGAALSTSTGTPAATASAAWTQMYVTATPPASAAYVQASVAASGGTISASANLYLDQLQLEEGTTPGTWHPGTGVLPVQVVSVVDQWPFYQIGLRDGPVMVLQEVD